MEFSSMLLAVLICLVVFFSFYNSKRDNLLIKSVIFIFVLFIGGLCFNSLAKEIDFQYRSYRMIIFFIAIFTILEKDYNELEKYCNEKNEDRRPLIFLESLCLGYVISILILPIFDSLYWLRIYNDPIFTEIYHSIIATTLALIISEIMYQISKIFKIFNNSKRYHNPIKACINKLDNKLKQHYELIKMGLSIILVLLLIPIIFYKTPIATLNRELPHYTWWGQITTNHLTYFRYYRLHKFLDFKGNYYLHHKRLVFKISTLKSPNRLAIHHNILYLNLRHNSNKYIKKYGILQFHLYQVRKIKHHRIKYYFRSNKNVMIYKGDKRINTLKTKIRLVLYKRNKLV